MFDTYQIIISMSPLSSLWSLFMLATWSVTINRQPSRLNRTSSQRTHRKVNEMGVVYCLVICSGPVILSHTSKKIPSWEPSHIPPGGKRTFIINKSTLDSKGDMWSFPEGYQKKHLGWSLSISEYGNWYLPQHRLFPSSPNLRLRWHVGKGQHGHLTGYLSILLRLPSKLVMNT